MLTTFTFSSHHETASLAHGRVSLGDIRIVILNDRIRTNVELLPWPGKLAATLRGDKVFGYIVALSPSDYSGLLTVNGHIHLFSRIVSPISGKEFPGFLGDYTNLIGGVKEMRRLGVSNATFVIENVDKVNAFGKLGGVDISIVLSTFGNEIRQDLESFGNTLENDHLEDTSGDYLVL